jgi:hypothetical protein
VRMAWPGSWLRYPLAWVGLVIVIAGWVIVTIAALVASIAVTAIRRVRVGITSSLPSAQFLLRLGAALLVSFLFVVWFIVAITYPFPPLLTFASITVLSLVGVWLRSPRTVSPFGAVPEWWKVYQIALEEPSGLSKYGRVRFGDGKVEFQFEAESQPDALLLDPFDSGRPERLFPPDPLAGTVGRDPLWDRWIDG